MIGFEVSFTKDAWKEYQFFLNNNKRIAERIVLLVNAIAINPFTGIGKPEPLKHKYRGYWSRRVDNENRLIYRFIDNITIEIVKCKGHYYDK